MNQSGNHWDSKKVSIFSVIVTMGIVFGDLGTSPLYTMRAILIGGKDNFNDLLVYGSISCIFWTLTLSTTIKYITIALRADNNGEGGIFALFALMKKKSSWAAVLTMIGGGALLADGVITPSITVTSAIEGLKIYQSGNPGCPNSADYFSCDIFCPAVRNQIYWEFIRAYNAGLVYNAWHPWDVADCSASIYS